jgi:hypothetical protein
MEKCTYCIQRISAARIPAEKENRRIREGELQTACQQACPAQAIVFGDLNSPGANVARLKTHALDYSMLGQLNTRPRTTYLAKITNPNAEAQDTTKGPNPRLSAWRQKNPGGPVQIGFEFQREPRNPRPNRTKSL